MGSVPECAPDRGGPSSRDDASRGANVSPPSGRRYISLRGRDAFRRVLGRGRRRSNGGVVVIVAEGSPGPPRVGVVAGKKRVGGAVQRNRVRRRLREACMRVSLRDGHDYVVIGSREVIEVPFGVVEEWLRRAVDAETASE